MRVRKIELNHWEDDIRDKELSLQEFKELQKFIYDKSGMFFPFSRKRYIEKKIFVRMNNLNIKEFKDYFEIIKKELIRTEIIHLFNEITVNETFFFRDNSQLVAFEKVLIPELIKAGRKKIKILSAACSSGEEVYTLSIILREKFPSMDFKIIGVDISAKMISKAIKGEYTDYSVRFVPKNYYNKYFIKKNERHLFKQEFKNGIEFKKANLMNIDMALLNERFDIIFCRYVLIYFDRESKKIVVDKLYRLLNHNGFFIMGNSESLFSVTDKLKILHFPSAIIYKKE